MAHTSGPWGIDWDIRPDIVTENRKGGYLDEGHIATMSKYENNPDDARLVAAAPDLLAACREIFNCLPHFYDGNKIKPELEPYAGVLSVIGKVALQAIEKAEGQ